MTSEYELLRNITFPKAYDYAEEKGLEIASFRDVQRILDAYPKLTGVSGHIITGTLAAWQRGLLGKTIVFNDKPLKHSEKIKVTFLVPDKFRNWSSSLLMMHPNAYKFDRKPGEWIFSVTRTDHPMIDSVNLDMEDTMRKFGTEIRVGQRDHYAGPIFMGGAYGKDLSMTLSPSYPGNFLLVSKSLEEKIYETPVEAPSVETPRKKEPKVKTADVKKNVPYIINFKNTPETINELLGRIKTVIKFDELPADSPIKAYLSILDEARPMFEGSKEEYEKLKKKAHNAALRRVSGSYTRSIVGIFFVNILKEK